MKAWMCLRSEPRFGCGISAGRPGPRNAALYGLLTFARETGVIPLEALEAAVRESPIAQYVPAEALEDLALA